MSLNDVIGYVCVFLLFGSMAASVIWLLWFFASLCIKIEEMHAKMFPEQDTKKAHPVKDEPGA